MSYSLLIIRRKREVITAALAAMVLFLAASFAFPLKYGATGRILIIPRSSSGVDPYTAVKSAERLSENLSQIVFTTSFFERVVRAKPGFNLDDSAFSEVSELKKRKIWRNMVLPQVLRGTSLLSVTVFHQDREQAKNWSSAVSYILQTQGGEYIGSDAQIKVVDAPIVSRFPVKPNFLLNGFFGLILGGFLGAVWAVWKRG